MPAPSKDTPESTKSPVDKSSTQAEADAPSSDSPLPKSAKTSDGKLARLQSWINSHKPIVIAVVAILVALISAFVFTDLKYLALGWLVETKGDVTVLDSRTNQPLLDAQVEIGGQRVLTGKDGKASLQGLHIGKSTLAVTKKAYKDFSRPQKLKFSFNHLQSVALESTGISVVVQVNDKISGLPVEGAQVTAGDIKAVTSDKGEAMLSLVPTKFVSEAAQITKDGFIAATLNVTVKPNLPAQPATLTPSGKVYFLSNRSGRIDLYQSNLDGSEATVIVGGTGQEDEATGILLNVANPDQLAIVSSREGHRDQYGTLKHDLFLYNSKTSQLTKIESDVGFSSRRAWIGNYLVYEHANADSGCGNLKVYSLASGQASVIAGSAGTLGCARLTTAFKDSLLFSVTNPSRQDLQGIYTIEPSGQQKQKLDSTPADKVVRQAKDTLLYEYYDYSQSYPTSEVWKSLSLATRKVSSLPNGPTIENDRAYVDSPDGQSTAFIDSRDGKTELYINDSTGEKKLTSLGSANQFVQWYGNKYVVISSTKSDENALYAVALAGGAPKKVTDFYIGNSRTYAGGYNPNY